MEPPHHPGPHPFARCRPGGRGAEAGQASVEYVAAVTLAAAALAGAGAGAGAVAAGTHVGTAVAHSLRSAICVVAGDVCRPEDARAAGLPPCAVREHTNGNGEVVTVASIRFGSRDELTATRRSDGTIAVVRTTGSDGGVAGGVGATFSPLGIDFGAAGSLVFQLRKATGWVFPDAPTARRFVAALPDSAEDRARWPLAWRSLTGGDQAAAQVGAQVWGHTIVGLAASASLAAGTRIAADGAVTVYVRASTDGPDAVADMLGSTGRGSTGLLAEYTFDRRGPRSLVFRRAEPHARGNRVVETVGRLNLRDPSNLAVARPLIDAKLPWPPSAVRQVSAVLRRIAQAGIVERYVYAVNDSSRTFDVGGKLGLEMGLDLDRTRIDRRLLDASAWTHGSPERERYDCLR